MVRVYVIRHGQTDSNLRNACIGLKDISLNKTGRRQARELASRLRDISADTVYTSPLKRAVDTISPYVEQRGLNMRMSFGLIERDFGEWDDMTFDEIEERFPDEYRAWRENWFTYRPPKGESAADVQERVNVFLERMLGEHKDGNVFIVTHLGTARHIMAGLLGLATEDSRCFTLSNTGVAVIEIDDKGKGVLTELIKIGG